MFKIAPEIDCNIDATAPAGDAWFGVYTLSNELVALCPSREHANAWIERAPTSYPDLVARRWRMRGARG